MGSHRKYFMPKEFYEIPKGSAVTREPYNILTPNEWLDVIHHCFAHEIEPGPESTTQPKGVLKNYLELVPPETFLTTVVRNYVEDNVLIRECPSCGIKFFNEDSCLAPHEQPLDEKVFGLYVELSDGFAIEYKDKKTFFDTRRKWISFG